MEPVSYVVVVPGAAYKFFWALRVSRYWYLAISVRITDSEPMIPLIVYCTNRLRTVLFRKLFHGLPVLSASFPEYENNLLVKSARHFQVTVQLPEKDVNV